jgi:hypothetical protein
MGIVKPNVHISIPKSHVRSQENRERTEVHGRIFVYWLEEYRLRSNGGTIGSSQHLEKPNSLINVRANQGRPYRAEDYALGR